MFGLSFGELVVLVIVAVVVIGPRDLPKILRKLGQWSGKLRRMASELRAQSGIDDVLRADGLGDDIAEIRKLARGELDHVRAAGSSLGGALSSLTSSASSHPLASGNGSEFAHGTAPLSHTSGAGDRHGDLHGDPHGGHDTHGYGYGYGYGHGGGVHGRQHGTQDAPYDEVEMAIARDREYPREGADSYQALPDTAIVYDNSMPASDLATDALYMMGDASAHVPSPVVAREDPLPSAHDTQADAESPAPPQPAAPTASGAGAA